MATLAIKSRAVVDECREQPSTPSVTTDTTKSSDMADIVQLRPAPQPLNLSPRLNRITYEAEAVTTPPAWLVKGMIPRAGLGMLYGESSAGKTFLAVHMALRVAYGLDFFGRRVKQGGVVIVAAEGGASVITRLRAAERELASAIMAANPSRKAEGLPPLKRAPIEVVTDPPNLGPSGSPGPLILTVAEAADSIERAGHRMALVIVDTLHASMGSGDENSASDIGAVLRPTRKIAEEHGCHLMFLHHPGKDLEKGARGSNSLFAAMDTVIELRVPGHEGQKPKSNALRRAVVVKLRDGETGTTFAYRLPVVETGRDEDGDPLTTCFVEPVVVAEQHEPGVKLTRQARDLLALLRGLVGPDGRANLAIVRDAFSKTLKSGTKDSAARMAWKRATESLVSADLIESDQEANQISLIGPSLLRVPRRPASCRRCHARQSHTPRPTSPSSPSFRARRTSSATTSCVRGSSKSSFTRKPPSWRRRAARLLMGAIAN
jgi:hypothetical protein